MSFEELVALTRVIGLAVFLMMFLGVLVWVFRPGSRQVYDANARIPFADESKPGRDRHG